MISDYFNSNDHRILGLSCEIEEIEENIEPTFVPIESSVTTITSTSTMRSLCDPNPCFEGKCISTGY